MASSAGLEPTRVKSQNKFLCWLFLKKILCCHYSSIYQFGTFGYGINTNSSACVVPPPETKNRRVLRDLALVWTAASFHAVPCIPMQITIIPIAALCEYCTSMSAYIATFGGQNNMCGCYDQTFGRIFDWYSRSGVKTQRGKSTGQLWPRDTCELSYPVIAIVVRALAARLLAFLLSCCTIPRYLLKYELKYHYSSTSVAYCNINAMILHK